MPSLTSHLPPPLFRLGHCPALDGLRGCAILAVMLTHTLPAALPGAAFGVDVFFVLSGFLITALLLQEWQTTGSVSLRRFYLRRALRLLPVLYVFLLASWLYARLFCTPFDAQLTRNGAVAVLLYFFNWKMALRPGPYTLLVHTWSLSVEEQFYLLWPIVLVCLLRLRIRPRWVLGLVQAAVVASIAERFLLTRLPVSTWIRIYYGTDTRVDALLIGCLVGLLASWGLLPRKGWPLNALRTAALLAVPILLLHARVSPGFVYFHRGGLTVVALSTAAIVAALLQSPPRLLAWILERPLLAWVGRVSYGLYLWHGLVIWHLLPRLQAYLVGRGVLRAHSDIVQVVVGFPAALAVAALSFALIERPFLSLKARIGQASRSAVPVVNPPLAAAA